MKPVKITVAKSRKVNIGNFENADYFASLEAELNEADNISEVASELGDQCKAILAAEIRKDLSVQI